MKKPLLLSSILLASFSAVSAQVTWEGEWTDATTFAGATPSWSTTSASGGSILEAPNPTIFTTTLSQTAWASPSSGFDASTATGSTVEFRMRVNSVASGANYAALVQIFGSNDGGTPRRFDLNIGGNGSGGDGVQFFTAGQSSTFDTSVFNTYRITFAANSADLYINGNTTAAISNQSGGSNIVASLNTLRIGDITSSDTVAGATEWEYVRWTNSGEFAPVPEPAAFASMVGLLALGAVLLRRRRA